MEIEIVVSSSESAFTAGDTIFIVVATVCACYQSVTIAARVSFNRKQILPLQESFLVLGCV